MFPLTASLSGHAPVAALVWGAFLLAAALPGALGSFQGAVSSGWPAGTAFLPSRMAASAGWHLSTVAGAAVLCLAFLSPGLSLLRFTGSIRARPAMRVALGFPLGYAAVSFALLGLLLVRLWFPALLWTLLAAAVLLSGPGRMFRVLSAAVPRGRPSAPALAAGVSLILLLPWMLSPELHTDAYEYHLAGPWQWLAFHGIAVRNSVSAFHYPSLAELPYAFGLLAGNDGIPKWFPPAFLACGVSALAIWAGGGTAAGWGVLALLSCATIGDIVGYCKNDGMVVALVILAFCSFSRAGAGRSVRILLGGVFCGLAVSVKYTASVALLFPLLAVGLSRGEWLRFALAGLAGGAVLGLPWAAKSFFLTGDPLFPVLSGYFPGLVDGWGTRNGEVWRNWHATGRGDGGSPASYVAYLIRECPALLLALPAALFARGPARITVLASLALSLACFMAFPDPQQARWFFPLLVPAVFLSVAALAGGDAGRHGRLRPAIMGALAALVLAGTLSRVAAQFRHGNPVPYSIGMESREGLLDRTLGTYREAMTVLAEMAPKDRGTVLAEGEIHSYLAPLPILMGTPLNSGEAPLFWKMVDSSVDEADLARKFRQLGVGIILHNLMRAPANAGIYAPFAWDSRKLALLERFFGSRTSPVLLPSRAEQRNGVFYAYRVAPVPSRRPADFQFTLPGAEWVLGEGIRAVKEGRNTEARGYMEGVVARFPRVGQFTNVLAHICYLTGDYARARDLYRGPVERGMVDDTNLFEWAWVSFETGRYADAMEGFSRSVETYPDLAEKSLICLCHSRSTLVAGKLKGGDVRGAEAIVRSALADRRPSEHMSRGRARELDAEYRAANAVVLEAMGRRGEAEAELARLGKDHPWMREMTLRDLREKLCGPGKPE